MRELFNRPSAPKSAGVSNYRETMLDHLRTPARILAATLAWAALSVSEPVAAQGVHGAIAFGTETDQGNGVAYGFAWNFPAKDSAHVEAMNACISSGGTNCVQLAWFQDGCGALAMDQHGNAQGKPGMTREQAEARALRTCEAAGGAGCDIVGSLCTAPDGEPGMYSGSESVLPAQEEQEAQTTVAETDDEALAREDRVLIQQALNALGFDAGSADGIFGPRTRGAIFEWQSAGGHDATGYVTREQADFLMAADATLDQVQEPRQEAADNQPGNVLIFDPATRPKCAEEQFTEEGDCWNEFSNKPGCFFLSYFDWSYTYTWSGDCHNGAAHGSGTFIPRYENKSDPPEWMGEMVHGVKQGIWQIREISRDGRRNTIIKEGTFVDGKWNGRWVERHSKGCIIEGQLSNGWRVGRWTWRCPSGRNLWQECKVGSGCGIWRGNY